MCWLDYKHTCRDTDRRQRYLSPHDTRHTSTTVYCLQVITDRWQRYLSLHTHATAGATYIQTQRVARHFGHNVGVWYESRRRRRGRAGESGGACVISRSTSPRWCACVYMMCACVISRSTSPFTCGRRVHRIGSGSWYSGVYISVHWMNHVCLSAHWCVSICTLNESALYSDAYRFMVQRRLRRVVYMWLYLHNIAAHVLLVALCIRCIHVGSGVYMWWYAGVIQMQNDIALMKLLTWHCLMTLL